MIVPVGVDRAFARRLPIVTVVLIALNVAVFVLSPQRTERAELARRYVATARYWREHPYLRLPPEARERFRWRSPSPDGEPVAEAPSDPAVLAQEQRDLDVLAGELVTFQDGTFVRRYAMVPARGLLQPGWVTATFLHADLDHLFFNMLFFAALGAGLLESVWGHLFFAALFVVGGVAASALSFVLDPDSAVSAIGASGAIAATMGAFAVRFARLRVKLLVWCWIFFRTVVRVPAWAYCGFLFAGDLVNLAVSGQATGIGYAAHVGGFLFGAAVANALRRTRLESRLAVRGEPPPGASPLEVHAAAELELGHLAEAERLWLELLASEPAHRGALRAVALISVQRGLLDEATERVERLLSVLAAAGDVGAIRAVLAELGHRIAVERVSPLVAYRVASLLRDVDAHEALRFGEVAARAEGVVGLKARLATAERLAATVPDRARELAATIAGEDGAPAELRERASGLLSRLRPAIAPAADASGLELDYGDRARPAGATGAVSPEPACEPAAMLARAVAVGAGLRCSRHPGARAGWRCEACDAYLCPGCTGTHQAGPTELAVCARCGSAVQLLVVHRRDRMPLLARLRDAVSFPARRGALGILGALALALWVLGLFGWTGRLLAVWIGFGALFDVIRSTSRGRPDLQALGLDDVVEDVLAPPFRGIAATAPLWALAVVFVAVAHGVDSVLALVALSVPVYLAVCLYVPAALLMPACGGRLRHVMAPDVVIRAAVALGRDYLGTAACVAALFLVEVGVVYGASAVSGTGVPFLSRWLALAAASYLPLVIARLLGLLLWVRGDALGLGVAGDYLEPALPGAVPRARPAPVPMDGAAPLAR